MQFTKDEGYDIQISERVWDNTTSTILADTSYDFEDASKLFPFIEPNINDIISNRDLQTWLRGKKIYLSIDPLP